jgi:hypothetical protein
MVGNDWRDPFVADPPVLQGSGSAVAPGLTWPGHLDRIVGMYDGLACASQGPRGDWSGSIDRHRVG